jgi:hypothetical protein
MVKFCTTMPLSRLPSCRAPSHSLSWVRTWSGVPSENGRLLRQHDSSRHDRRAVHRYRALPPLSQCRSPAGRRHYPRRQPRLDTWVQPPEYDSDRYPHRTIETTLHATPCLPADRPTPWRTERARLGRVSAAALWRALRASGVSENKTPSKSEHVGKDNPTRDPASLGPPHHVPNTLVARGVAHRYTLVVRGVSPPVAR